MSNEPLGSDRPAQFTLRYVFVVVAVIAMLLGITLPAVRHARENAERIQCRNNMKQTALAMRNYLDYQGCFPPAYVADKQGRPLNGWRAILLPHLECGNLVPSYRFDMPWDSPGNLRYSAARINTYHCPCDPLAAGNETNYLAIVGPGMFWEGPAPTRFESITDGAANTIALVEALGAKIPWAAPRDLEAGKVTFAINAPQPLGISSNHPGCANVAMCDGSVRTLSNSTSPEHVRALCTRSGGEKVEP